MADSKLEAWKMETWFFYRCGFTKGTILHSKSAQAVKLKTTARHENVLSAYMYRSASRVVTIAVRMCLEAIRGGPNDSKPCECNQ